MIQFNSETGEINLNGTGPELLSEVFGLVHMMYKMFERKDPKLAALFKEMFLKNAENAFLDMDELISKTEKNKREAKEVMGRTINKLEEILSLLKEKSNRNDEDIRSADFMSDEEFHKWFNGGNE